MKCGPHLASELDKRITIQTLSLVPNDSGGSVETWSTFVQAWAKINPRLGNERFFGQRLEEIITHVLTIRYVPGITATMRVLYRDRIFQIKSAINELENDQTLFLLCQEGVAT